MKRLCKIYATLSIVLVATIGKAQTDTLKSHRSFFVEPEILGGRIVPNYQGYPPSGPRETVDINIGSSNVDDKQWAKYYNHPDIGLLFSYTLLGNPGVWGNEADVMTFISFNTTRRQKRTWHIKFGLGASYFTKHYDSVTNPTNLAIGATFTWAFRMFAYRSLYVNKNINLRLCGGYCHSSDGHTQLPNFGLNSAVLGLSMQFNTSHPDPDFVYPEKVKDSTLPIEFLQLRTGIGMHERGSPIGPVGGAKYEVYSAALSGGVILKKHLKLRTGFTYRNYEKLIDYTGQPYTYWQASNIFFSIGCEWLVGHIGMDVETGINIYKPFYYDFYKRYEGSTTTAMYFLKSAFPLRLGLNYYFIDPMKNTRCNVFFGANIDANFGQADFSELSLGYSFRF